MKRMTSSAQSNVGKTRTSSFKTLPYLSVLLISLLHFSCSEGLLLPESKVTDSGGFEDTESEWCIMVYMAADNELEVQAISDLNEMEAGYESGRGIKIVSLLDRCEGFDTSNGNWTDTRILEIVHDEKGLNTQLCSQILDCPELGIAAGEEVEIDTGLSSSLSGFIDYTMQRFPSNNYALVIWGHGNGVRAGKAPLGSTAGEADRQIGRGSCVDDSSEGNFLSSPELRQAVEGRGLSIICFDNCFSANLELAYELRNQADYLIGSEGAEAADGWEYQDFLARLASGDLSQGAFIDAAIESYSTSYSDLSTACISAIRLQAVYDLNSALNHWSDALYQEADSTARAAEIRGFLFHSVEDFYACPGELFLDIGDLAIAVSGELDLAAAESEELLSALEDAVAGEWAHPDISSSHGISIHYVPLDGFGYPLDHWDEYFRGKPAAHPLEFVSNSTWVPSYPSGPGLLYRLWYEPFP